MSLISRKRWRVAAAAAAATLGVMSFAGVSAAAAATGPAPVHIIKVNLHSAFAKALGKAKHGPIEAKAAPFALPGTRVVKPRRVTAAACTEPNCSMNYGGGPVQHTPKVYLLLWGPKWSSTGTDTHYLHSFYSALGSGNDAWSRITSQYTDHTGHPVFSGSVLQGVYQDVNTPVGSDNGAVSSTDLNAEADAFVHNQGISDLGNAQVVIASQSGTCFDDGWVGQPSHCANPGPGPTYCAWHSGSGLGETFTNLPYSLDANGSNGYTCGANYVNGGSAGTYDGFSIVGGHEYAETITDPFPPSGWMDGSDPYGGEIGDKCAWGGANWGGHDPIGDVTIGTGRFAMQSLWSNSSGSCVMSAVTTLTGQIKGPYGKCLDDYNNLSKNGNKAQIWTCSTTDPSQQWTVAASGTGEIKHGGSCLDVTGNHTANGTKVQLWRCLNDAAQQWKFTSNGTLRHAGKCLDDTNKSTTNGTQVQIWTCTGKANQLWAKP